MKLSHYVHQTPFFIQHRTDVFNKNEHIFHSIASKGNHLYHFYVIATKVFELCPLAHFFSSFPHKFFVSFWFSVCFWLGGWGRGGWVGVPKSNTQQQNNATSLSTSGAVFPTCCSFCDIYVCINDFFIFFFPSLLCFCSYIFVPDTYYH